ncbi:fibrinogen C domain-containing protein 1-like [Gigantopelta aegis]|uniref:fibrinogen C domain-containing protein 1-like n=1 Tax=Gigantopelta aegis TaxID=1735272 RepID=UPI001B88952E|nr:fibrinogen C domain-containing protein 1-like [Gigantopelta aegis]
MDLKPVEIPTQQLNVSSKMVCSTKCYNDVTCTGFFYNYDGRCSTFSARFHSLTFVNETGTQAYEHGGRFHQDIWTVERRYEGKWDCNMTDSDCSFLQEDIFVEVSGVPTDCYDVMLSVAGTSGVYTIVSRDGGAPINVSCEMSSSKGSWLVIQRRTNGLEDFYKKWKEYKDGFGDLNNEFWLEQDYFRLSLGDYSGDAGDSLSQQNGYRFTAKDVDVDTSKSNCARKYHGAWWYENCHDSNLNGQYLRGTHSSRAVGVNWRAWRGYNYSLKRTEMKIRPMQF